MTFQQKSPENLVLENKLLLNELEITYKNLEEVLEQTSEEKKITYHELEENFKTLARSYKELSKKENLLVHLEKLSSIGQFISEIIHELKNPLTIISAHTELVLMNEPNEEVAAHLKQISQNVIRMSGYLNRFRNMAYKGQENFTVFDLNDNLNECLSTIEIINPKGVNIEVNLCDTGLMIRGDQYQTNQIFLNLAKNAFDAIKSHGDLLKVTSRPVTADWIQKGNNVGKNYCLSEKKWEKVLKEVHNFALIEFEDNGTGISNENIKGLFNAFFTTKRRSKGTGLGLSISSDIVKRHNGNIAVKSEIEFGTTFQILIPLVDNTDKSI